MIHPPSTGGRTDDESTPVLAVVVGAHPDAERWDRPQAYRVRDALADLHAGDEPPPSPARRGPPLVLTDVWYMNSPEFASCPAVAIGAPEVNALTARLTDRVPEAYVDPERAMVQMPNWEDRAGFGELDPIALCWGVGRNGTRRAVDVFLDHFAESYVRLLRASPWWGGGDADA